MHHGRCWTVALLDGGAAGPWIAGIAHDATASYKLGFCVGYRVLRLIRDGYLDSNTPQSAPCRWQGAECAITILGLFSCPRIIRYQVKTLMTFHWRP
jgi:hypothetical protein